MYGAKEATVTDKVANQPSSLKNSISSLSYWVSGFRDMIAAS